jgi:hypothetical protein
MKWGNKWRNGEMRTITKFAWLPIRIDRWEGAEWVWFETVKIEQCYHTNERISSSVGQDFKVWLFGGYWLNERFVPKTKDEIRNDKLDKLGI